MEKAVLFNLSGTITKKNGWNLSGTDTGKNGHIITVGAHNPAGNGIDGGIPIRGGSVPGFPFQSHWIQPSGSRVFQFTYCVRIYILGFCV